MSSLLKLGIQLSPRTVRKYLRTRQPGRPRGDLRWPTFLRSHARGIIACDFAVVVTATFRLLYVFIVNEHGSRRLVHCHVTAHPDGRLDPAAAARGHRVRCAIPVPAA